MNKIRILFLVLCLICANISFAIAEPVLPRYVIPQSRAEVRRETSQSNDNIIVIAETNDLLQVIGYSYDMEGNLWWRVIDYRTGKDGYIIAASLDEMDETQAEKKKEQIDSEASISQNTPKPTAKPTAKPAKQTSSYSSGNRTTFTNAYGTSTTRCAVSGCNNYIASSGDTNCCTIHSNRCLECRKYIDGDATYCMSCLTKALLGD